MLNQTDTPKYYSGNCSTGGTCAVLLPAGPEVILYFFCVLNISYSPLRYKKMCQKLKIMLPVFNSLQTKETARQPSQNDMGCNLQIGVSHDEQSTS